MEKNLCKVCGSETVKLFSKKVLDKYDVSYYWCSGCGFMQTEKPYWLPEAYSSAIASVDVGLVNRNIQFSNVIEDIIYKYFDKHGKFLDFAGGYGLFVRIMRDKGFDFYRKDKYCENLFAKHFDINDLPDTNQKFELITAFEFMEHSENPFKELNWILSMADSFLFSTELIPNQDVENWWYLGAEHGQHISFYTKHCLEVIAKKYDKIYYGCGHLHLFTNKKDLEIFKNILSPKNLIRKIKEKVLLSGKLKSKTWEDFQIVIKKEKR